MGYALPSTNIRALIQLLSTDLTWGLLDVLQRSDARLDELSDLTGQPQADITAILAQLVALDIVTSRPSDANPAQVYHQLRLDQLRALSQQLLTGLHPTLALADSLDSVPTEHPRRPRVLFLCTENSARSQLAEGLLRQISRGNVEAYSAGTQPGTIHPLVTTLLGEAGQQLYAKHLDVFQGQFFDYVVTVCDRAREICPSFPGAVRYAHWSIPDPATSAEPQDVRTAFTRTTTELSQRIRTLLIFIERDQRPTTEKVLG